MHPRDPRPIGFTHRGDHTESPPLTPEKPATNYTNFTNGFSLPGSLVAVFVESVEFVARLFQLVEREFQWIGSCAAFALFGTYAYVAFNLLGPIHLQDLVL